MSYDEYYEHGAIEYDDDLSDEEREDYNDYGDDIDFDDGEASMYAAHKEDRIELGFNDAQARREEREITGGAVVSMRNLRDPEQVFLFKIGELADEIMNIDRKWLEVKDKSTMFEYVSRLPLRMYKNPYLFVLGYTLFKHNSMSMINKITKTSTAIAGSVVSSKKENIVKYRNLWKSLISQQQTRITFG